MMVKVGLFVKGERLYYINQNYYVCFNTKTSYNTSNGDKYVQWNKESSFRKEWGGTFTSHSLPLIFDELY